MRNFVLLVVLAFSSINCAASNAISHIGNQEISFILNKLSILLEYKSPKEFPAKIRLISIPDPEDQCEWIGLSEGITTEIMESSCPQKQLMLTLTNWDQEAEFHTFDLGSALNWSVISLNVSSINNMSQWSANLMLEVLLINDKGVYKEEVTFEITNRDDEYSIILRE